MTTACDYVGRFAPSPTGPLHFGSLLAAVASYLEAKVRGGRWLVRIEDIDPPREEVGASDAILRELEAFGFEWDGTPIFQSHSRERHEAAIDALLHAGLAYHCRCTRAILKRTARPGPMGYVYPGTCRDGAGRGARAVRVRTDDEPVTVTDRLQGEVQQSLESEIGDFLIRRRDGLIAYQLAVVVDDAAEGVTDVVRGIDLLDSTPRQSYLQRLLGLPGLTYMHIPIAVDTSGEKLSKQTGAPPVTTEKPAATLLWALEALRQRPPALLEEAPIDDIWRWARDNWLPERLQGATRVVCD